MKKLLTTSVLVIGTAFSAYAADLRPAYKAPPPAPPPPPSFTGCYLYGGGGYGLNNIDHFAEVPTGVTFTSTTTSGARGWLAGGGGGCDYQFGAGTGFWSNWVVGAFADADWMDLKKNFEPSFPPSLLARRKNRRLGPSGGGLATWSLRMFSLTGMAATPKLALIR